MAASGQTPPPGLALRGLSKTYGEGRAAVRALKSVDLNIAPGQFVVVLGPSGSGKTTLLNLIGGIESPSAGRLLIDGVDVAAMSVEERTTYRRERVGFVFQFFNLIPTLSALENVQLVAELVKGDAEAASRRALERVGLNSRVDHFPSALSGGEQQRVAIARAVVKEPPLLLCDEPTGSLDLDTGRQILALLRAAGRRDGRTLLLVTHNSVIARVADRVVRMRSGEVVADETVTQPIAPEEVEW
ncbi:MAG: ABC transporter ATP-binding protein [Thermoleophilia bacterium]|nr:ABC transporter ATP-binding protein [Thermoleophilia bacterium]